MVKNKNTQKPKLRPLSRLSDPRTQYKEPEQHGIESLMIEKRFMTEKFFFRA